jgi:thiosulfate/3-mercaptopyruvate sulfurtransferase
MNPLVSVNWLAEHLSDPNFIVMDATLPPVGIQIQKSPRERYLAEHIPGAIFFDIDELSDHSTQLPHMLPTVESFSREMSSMGVNDQMTIVIYEQDGVFSAPRAWWMLRTFGVEKVLLLDGGFHAWKEACFPVEAGSVKRSIERFQGRFNQKAVKDFAEIQELILNRAQILDARSKGRFSGHMPEPRPGIHSGHMPSSLNTPFTELVSEGRLKSVSELQAYFKGKKINLEKPVTTTCGSGVTAAVVALGLEIAGAKQVSLYDGSWAEYAQRPEAVIERIEES